MVNRFGVVYVGKVKVCCTKALIAIIRLVWDVGKIGFRINWSVLCAGKE